MLLNKILSNETTESVSFLNDMVSHLWPYINVAVSGMIKDIVEPMFADMLPGPFKNTKFTKIDLGTKPMVFDRIDVHVRSQDSIKLDVDVHWDGECDIKLKTPIFGTNGVRRIGLAGRMSVMMQPLVPVMPIVSAIQLGFINPPELDMDFTGLADVADISLLRSGIRDVIGSVFASLLVLPNRLLVPINLANDYFATYILPIGVLRLKLESGNGFVTTGKLMKDVPDVYLKACLGAEKMIQTKTVSNENDPTWNESFDFIYADKEQLVHIHAYDSDLNGDDDQGGIIFPVSKLLEAPGNQLTVPLKFEGELKECTVTVSAETLETSTLKSNFNTKTEDPSQMVGFLSVMVAGAENIPDHPDLAPFCKVRVGEDKFVTPVVVKCPGVDPTMPQFNSMFRVNLTSEGFHAAPEIEFELLTGEHSMGKETVEFSDVLESHEMKYRKDIEMEHGSTLRICAVLSSLSC